MKKNEVNRIMGNKTNKSVRWGDIFFCDLGETKGSVQSGIRPVIVVQTDRLSQKSPTAVVAVLTTVIKKSEMNTHILLGTEYGLPEPSMIMLEQMRTVDVDNELIEYVGTVTNNNKINEIKKGLKYVIGIPLKPKAERKAVILSLCTTCRQEFFDAKDYFIKRMDPFQTGKECCEKCQVGYGYDYLVSKKYNREEQKSYGKQNGCKKSLSG